MSLYPEKRDKFYYIDGKRYISVTAVLEVINKPQLVTWAARQAAQIALAEPSMSSNDVISAVFNKRDRAADLGSFIHNAIRTINTPGAKLINVPTEIRGHIDAFQEFCNAIRPVSLATEITCYSNAYGFAGRADWVIKLPAGGVWLIDFKTGGIYKEAGLQMAAYKEAINEMIDIGLLEIPKIESTYVVRLRGDGLYELKPFNSDFKKFLAAKELWEWTNEAE